MKNARPVPKNQPSALDALPSIAIIAAKQPYGQQALGVLIRLVVVPPVAG